VYYRFHLLKLLHTCIILLKAIYKIDIFIFRYMIGTLKMDIKNTSEIASKYSDVLVK